MKKQGKVDRCLGSYYLEPEFWLLDGPRMFELVVSDLLISKSFLISFFFELGMIFRLYIYDTKVLYHLKEKVMKLFSGKFIFHM